MRTNGFALFTGEDSRGEADRAVAKVRRFSREVLKECVQTGIGRAELVAYVLDDAPKFPLVHGLAGGEYASVERDRDNLVAFRDRLGTRPLYVDRKRSCVATDHRFLEGDAELLPGGSTFRMGHIGKTISRITPQPVPEGLEECAAALAGTLTESVATRVKGKRKVAVSFSGGLDSSLIALIASKYAEVVLCSVYARGSRDEGHVAGAARTLGLELSATEMDDAALSKELHMIDLPFAATSMDMALWSIYSATARDAAGQGAELMMLGQLADELFGGYAKYAREAMESEGRAASMMLEDVVASGERAFVRDELACARFTEARFPFADDRVVSFALGVPVRFKISGSERKVVLRRAASILGLPEGLVDAPKKAAQYSSGVAKLVTRVVA